MGNAKSEQEFLDKGCNMEEELCICACLRLGWMGCARSMLSSGRRTPRLRVRNFAQATKEGAAAVLARLHARYPQHVKMLPAIEWAQTAETLLVRVRFARYTRGEALFLRSERHELHCDDASLFLLAEGDDKPAFIETTLRWRHPLRRHDGCADSEDSCPTWAAEGACDLAPVPDDAPPLSKRCALSCGLCPAINGTSEIDATWVLVPGAIVFEARKAKQGRWERLLEAKLPPYRIDAADALLPPPLTLLNCTTACEDAAGCSAAGEASSPSSPVSTGWRRLWTGTGGNANGVSAGEEGWAVCSERCRIQCGNDLGSKFALQ